MGRTTIQVQRDTKSRLDKRKHENESYDACINRILNDEDGVLHTEAEIRKIAREVAQDEISQYSSRP